MLTLTHCILGILYARMSMSSPVSVSASASSQRFLEEEVSENRFSDVCSTFLWNLGEAVNDSADGYKLCYAASYLIAFFAAASVLVRGCRHDVVVTSITTSRHTTPL